MGRPYQGRSLGRLRPVPVAPGGGGGGTPPDPSIDLNPARGGYNVAFAGNRIPQFIVDTQWRTEMQALDAANDPWFAGIKARGISGSAYADDGQYGAIMYQVTGTTSYATAAYNRAAAYLITDKTLINGNDVREKFAAMVIIFDWIYAALNPTQRADLMSRLHTWAEFACGIGMTGYSGSLTILGDSDATIGYYGGMLLIDCLNIPENTQRNWLSKLCNVREPSGPTYGGVNSTGANMSSARNAINRFFTQLATGGNWIESSAYNDGTTSIYLQWYAAAKSAMLTDHFPEITAHIATAGRWFVRECTPTFSDRFQWGDDQNPHEFAGYRCYAAYEAAAMCVGVLGRAGHADAPLIHKFVQDIRTLYPSATSGSSFVSRAAMAWYNPLSTQAADYSSLGTDGNAVGVGRRIVDLATGTRVCFFTPNRVFVDHEVNHYCNVQAWHGGELALYNPIGYGAGVDTVSVNGVLLCGINAMDARAVVRQEGSVAAGWVASTWSTQGSAYVAGFYEPPPPFVTKAECRQVAFREAGHLVIVTRDDLDVKDPSTLTGGTAKYVWYGYAPKMDAALARGERVARIWHTDNAATSIAGGFEWLTMGGQRCAVYHPVGFGSKVHYDEKVSSDILDLSYGLIDSVKRFQTRVIPPTQDVNVMVNVYMVGANGATRPVISSASAGAITVGTKVVTFGASTTTVV